MTAIPPDPIPPVPPPNQAHEPSELEASLWGVVSMSRRVLYVIAGTVIVLIFLLIAAVIILGLRVVNDEHVNRQSVAAAIGLVEHAECDNHYSIATAPISQLTTKTGVTIIEANRKAFTVLHCPGALGPPPPGLIHEGEKLGVPIRY